MSTSVTAMPLTSIGSVIRSRVVPGTLGHDGAVGSSEGIEEARLADVRTTREHNRRPVADHAPAAAILEERVDAVDDLAHAPLRLFRIDEVVALVGKIERRFEPRDQIEQRCIERSDPAGQRAFELIERDARLQRRRRGNQIRHGFRLHEIDPAGEKRAQCEFARARKPCARVDGGMHDRTQDHGAAVRGDLNDVVAGVGVRRLEVGRDDAVRRAGRRCHGGCGDARQGRASRLERRAPRRRWSERSRAREDR